MNKRCIALYSGGLDSILAVKLLQEQSIEVIPVFFYSPFFGSQASREPETFKELHRNRYGIDVRDEDFSLEMIRIIGSPKHGFGKHLNPCIDCKIGMIRKAGSMMDPLGASFVVTGEVLGQRPMSQRRDSMDVILKDTGLKDILLRPLSAKLLKPTLAERTGIVDRERLLALSGRGRKPQMELAARYGIRECDVPAPAGGCLLTYEQIANKVRSTFERFRPGLPAPADLMLDVAGRQFLLDEISVLVVSRDEKENDVLAAMRDPGNIFMKIENVSGPLSVFRGNPTADNLSKAAAVCLRYGKGRGQGGHVALYGPDPHAFTGRIDAPVVTDDCMGTFRIDLNN